MHAGNHAITEQDIKNFVKGAQEGSPESFANLYAQFYDKIFRYLYFKTANKQDAEDLTEDVFLRMLESISSFKWKKVPFSSWLFRIAHNLVVDYYRKRSRQKSESLDFISHNIGESSDDMDRILEMNLSIKQVLKSMENLTDLQKEVMSLRFAAGFSIAETAHVMHRSENAVKALQHASIKKLRKVLLPEKPIRIYSNPISESTW